MLLGKRKVIFPPPSITSSTSHECVWDCERMRGLSYYCTKLESVCSTGVGQGCCMLVTIFMVTYCVSSDRYGGLRVIC